MNGPSPASYFACTNDIGRLPVAAFDEDVGAADHDGRERRVLVEPGHEIDRGERGQDGHAVLERVERSIGAKLTIELPGGLTIHGIQHQNLDLVQALLERL